LKRYRKIAYITDIHLDEQFVIDNHVDAKKNWEIALNDIASRGFKEVVFGGDIGEKSAHKSFFESLQAYDLSIVLGNHDVFHDVVHHYSNGVNPDHKALYYAQEDAFYKYVFLDSSIGMIRQEQFEWFKTALLTPKKIILFVHHPILSVNAEVDKRFPLDGRDKLKAELLKTDKEVILFCGHYHFEDVRTHANILQYITPASSYQVEKIPDEIKIGNHTFGYRIIEISEDEVNTELIMFEST